MKRIISILVSVLMLFSVIVPSVSATYGPGEDFLQKLSEFSNKLYVMAAEGEDENYAMSPLSVFLAFAMLHYVGDAGVKSELEEFCGMTSDDFAKCADLITMMERQSTEYAPSLRFAISESAWVDESASVNYDVARGLKSALNCDVSSVPFALDNEEANRIIRDFVKEKTNGLIDRDFALGEETLVTLINTIYFKDTWNDFGNDLPVETREFSMPSGVKETDFVLSYFESGEAAETESCRYFYARTANNYKVKFIVPKDGYTLADVMSEENLNEINSRKSYNTDTEFTAHFTRCIFPEFKTDKTTEMAKILSENGALPYTLSPEGFYNGLIDGDTCVAGIDHQTVLKVDRKGVEGAAVTAVTLAGTAFDGRLKVYHDFVVDRSFGFIVTNYNDTIIFEGQITDPVPDKETVSDVPGDADGDGEVTIKDVLLIRRALAGLCELSGRRLDCARISGGAILSGKDVLKLRRILAGLE